MLPRSPYADVRVSLMTSSLQGPAWLGWSRTYEAGWENGAVFNSDGTFNISLHSDFLEGQHALQQKIVAREMELGIGAILPGFSGKVSEKCTQHTDGPPTQQLLFETTHIYIHTHTLSLEYIFKWIKQSPSVFARQSCAEFMLTFTSFPRRITLSPFRCLDNSNGCSRTPP